MIVEFLRDFGEAYKIGQIIELPEDRARTLLVMGDAKESDLTSLIAASRKAAIDDLRTELLGEIRAARGTPPANGHAGGDGASLNGAGGVLPARRLPPGAGGTADFGNLPHQVEAEPARMSRDERNYHAGQIVKALICAQSKELGIDYESQEWGRNLLRNRYTVGAPVQYATGDDFGGVVSVPGTAGTLVGRTGTESISGGPTYGFLVRPEWADTLFRIPVEESVIEEFAYQVPVGQALEFNVTSLDQYNPPKPGQAAGYAGFELHRRGEITQRPYSDGKTNEIKFKVTDLTAFTTWSRDLDADAFIRIGAMIQQVLGQAFVWKKDYEFLLGNGTGMPMGILNGGPTQWPAPTTPNVHPSVLTQPRHAVNTISYNDVVRMMQRIRPSYWRDMYWLTNAAWTLEQLSALKDDSGAYVFQPNSLVGQWMTPSVMGEGPTYNRLWYRAEGRLQGKPVIFTEKLPALGTPGDLILVAPREAYGVATRQGLEMGMSEHFLFDTDRIAVRWKLRNDGQPMLRGPYIQSDGGVTTGNAQVSWCCILV